MDVLLDENQLPIAIIEAEAGLDIKGPSPGFVHTGIVDNLVSEYQLDHLTVMDANGNDPRMPFDPSTMMLLGADKMPDNEETPSSPDAMSKEILDQLKESQKVNEKLQSELDALKEAKEKELSEAQEIMKKSQEQVNTYQAAERAKLVEKIPEEVQKFLGGKKVVAKMDMETLENHLKFYEAVKGEQPSKPEDKVVVPPGVPPANPTPDGPANPYEDMIQIDRIVRKQQKWAYFPEEGPGSEKEIDVNNPKYKAFFDEYN